MGVRSMKLRLAAVGVLLLAGCGDLFGPEACTLEAQRALEIDVRDSETTSAVEEPTIRVSKDGRDEQVLPSGDGKFVVWGGEGTYTVTVSSPGYDTWTEEIRVGRDGCRILTRRITVELVRVI